MANTVDLRPTGEILEGSSPSTPTSYETVTFKDIQGFETLECQSIQCQNLVEKLHKDICLNHNLKVQHQITDNSVGNYQAVLYHGGEALFILDTGHRNLGTFELELAIYTWLYQVHKYEGLAL